ncbi:hypothetical protein G7047_18995 [Diaphorobacter sp. HDW4A]|uniref:hypothetical protein n=1 Tax=Diaphorobacter sp. HDW4A TaxID=2714924 RepID=UPI0014097F9D|nr:hypothetical protein [Diaphorobacter sp. HDW4A]QIL81768.1 hypothetical protein G7047_18995 [Diaphorobacter sp. HDW4A]
MKFSSTHQPLEGRGRPRGKVLPQTRVANPTPAAQYNRMAAPVWSQALAAPARDGALDHKNFASHGYRC